MTSIGLETECKHCHKCQWCAKWGNHDVITDKRWFTYSCQFPTHLPSFSRGINPTLDENCPHFGEPYKDEEL